VPAVPAGAPIASAAPAAVVHPAARPGRGAASRAEPVPTRTDPLAARADPVSPPAVAATAALSGVVDPVRRGGAPAAPRGPRPVVAARSPRDAPPPPGREPAPPTAHGGPPAPGTSHPVRPRPAGAVPAAGPVRPSPGIAPRRGGAGAPHTVHISIGRVEVRAAAEPATAPRREAPRQPVLSLVDYLRERAGGGHP
jgi:hypothetical protein